MTEFRELKKPDEWTEAYELLRQLDPELDKKRYFFALKFYSEILYYPSWATIYPLIYCIDKPKRRVRLWNFLFSDSISLKF